MILSFIVAMAQNRVIGKNNQMPWHLPEDLKRFRKITAGHPVIMGRKTFESIGRLLPKRENIVITRDQKYKPPFDVSAGLVDSETTLVIFHSLDDVLSRYQNQSGEVFVIGGGEIFKEALSKMDRLYLTLIHKDFEGDAFFPELNLEQFQISFQENLETSEKLPFSFINYEHKTV